MLFLIVLAAVLACILVVAVLAAAGGAAVEGGAEGRRPLKGRGDPAPGRVRFDPVVKVREIERVGKGLKVPPL